MRRPWPNECGQACKAARCLTVCVCQAPPAAGTLKGPLSLIVMHLRMPGVGVGNGAGRVGRGHAPPGGPQRLELAPSPFGTTGALVAQLHTQRRLDRPLTGTHIHTVERRAPASSALQQQQHLTSTTTRPRHNASCLPTTTASLRASSGLVVQGPHTHLPCHPARGLPYHIVKQSEQPGLLLLEAWGPTWRPEAETAQGTTGRFENSRDAPAAPRLSSVTARCAGCGVCATLCGRGGGVVCSASPHLGGCGWGGPPAFARGGGRASRFGLGPLGLARRQGPQRAGVRGRHWRHPSPPPVAWGAAATRCGLLPQPCVGAASCRRRLGARPRQQLPLGEG